MGVGTLLPRQMGRVVGASVRDMGNRGAWAGVRSPGCLLWLLLYTLVTLPEGTCRVFMTCGLQPPTLRFLSEWWAEAEEAGWGERYIR